MVKLEKLCEKTLRAIIKSQGIEGYETMSKAELIESFQSNSIVFDNIRVKESRNVIALYGNATKHPKVPELRFMSISEVLNHNRLPREAFGLKAATLNRIT